jgi:hypothetical protein
MRHFLLSGGLAARQDSGDQTMMFFQIFDRKLGTYFTAGRYYYSTNTASFREWRDQRVQKARAAKEVWRLISAERLAKVGNDPLKTRLTVLNNAGYVVTIKKPNVRHPHRLRPRTRRCYLEGRATYPEAAE